MKKLARLIVIVIIIAVALVGTFVGGAIFGYQSRPDIELVTELSNKQTGAPAQVDFAPFWQVWRVLDERFVPTTATTTATSTVSSQEKVWGAIGGLVDSLGDPYTVFLPPKQNKLFEQEVEGHFGGIGLELGVKDQALVVVSALPNTPAQAAGLKPGDRIVAIDGRVTSKLSLQEAISNIRGDVGTKVVLSIFRAGKTGQPFDVTLTRATINVPTLETKILPGNIFLISLYNFGGTSSDLFRGALEEFVKADTDKMIIDLRGNPGGYLNAAVDIASWFLPKDTVVVREQHLDPSESKVYRASGNDIFNDKLKLVILVDEGSASAAEILAGALKENGVATLVGEKTFGKGSVQELMPVAGDASLKVTIARWLTPKGVSISHDGLVPDVVAAAATSTNSTVDQQLNRAIEVVKAIKK